MPGLTLYDKYSRQEVHDIFSPETRFSSGTGTWGLHGIVEIPGKPGDFVFFVTFGQKQSGHSFDEWITEDGVMSWQSQPSQTLQDRRIQQFIHHDERQNTIYLFLRTQSIAQYTYFGTVKYLSHDPRREKPVYMYWQLTNWPLPANVVEHIDLKLQPAHLYPIGKANNMESQANNDTENNSFSWNEKTWQVDRQALITQVQELIIRGLPEEAIRFKGWYVEIGGQQVSVKWLFHLITGAGYHEFDSPTARNKLSKIGIVAKSASGIQETGATNQTHTLPLKSIRRDPQERKIFFHSVAQRLTNEHSETCQQARYRFPNPGNWFEIRLPSLTGMYSLRLARHYDEIGYYFPNYTRSAPDIFRSSILFLPTVTDETGFPVSVNLNATQDWGFLGFTIKSPTPLAEKNVDQIVVIYSDLMACFIRSTYKKLVNILETTDKKRSVKKSQPVRTDSRQNQLFESRVYEIKQALAGAVVAPSDEVLCDWVHFCYDFELYQEGNMLFGLVSPEAVNPWYFERTKKMARLCMLHLGDQ